MAARCESPESSRRRCPRPNGRSSARASPARRRGAGPPRACASSTETLRASSPSACVTNSGGRRPLPWTGTMSESSSQVPSSTSVVNDPSVGAHISVVSGSLRPCRSAIRASSSAPRIESPPSEKKSSSTPTRSTSSVSAQSSAISRSKSLRGGDVVLVCRRAPIPRHRDARPGRSVGACPSIPWGCRPRTRQRSAP